MFSYGRLLYSVLPLSVATDLRQQRPVPPKRFETVTLLFSGKPSSMFIKLKIYKILNLLIGIVGFSEYCSRNTDIAGASKIVTMLNELYTAFDSIKSLVKESKETITKTNELYYKILENILPDSNFGPYPKTPSFIMIN